jgi:hypothetical protein
MDFESLDGDEEFEGLSDAEEQADRAVKKQKK